MLQTAATQLWQSYRCPHQVHDEVRDQSGQIRPQWATFAEGLNTLPAEELARRVSEAERLLRENGVTYDVFREGDTPSRPWRMDLIPLILDEAEWRLVELGVEQRARLLECLLKDLYGARRSIAEKWLPPEVLFGQPNFFRPFYDLHAENTRSLVTFAAELARGRDGVWRVMADRTDAPVGVGFALEHRIVQTRTIPQWLHRQPVRRLAPFFMRMQQTLQSLGQRPVENPRIALLSPGPSSPFYFEDVFLAGYLGYTLVQGADLSVRDERVFLKTLTGLVPVHVILCRSPERGIDPLEMGGNAPHGVSGLLQAIRKGNVAVANVPGCGLVESPVFMSFLPRLCQRLLGEDLRIPSIDTWWCGDADARRYVLEHLSELVIKPAFEASGGLEILGNRLTQDERSQLTHRIKDRPHEFVGQSTIARSAAPVLVDSNRLDCGHVAMRAFAAAHPTQREHYDILPGGLIRIAPTPEPMKLTALAGGGSKDLWVLSTKPEEPLTLLQAADKPVPLRRSGALFPSRVADDLFWLGWAIERVDFLARLARPLIERLTVETGQEDVEVLALVRALADQGQIEPGFALSDLSGQLPALAEILPKLLLDREEKRGLGFACMEMRRLGNVVRDRLSPDAWGRLFASGNDFTRPAIDDVDLAEMLSRLNALIANQASVSGLIDQGMIRGPAWRFLDMGRRIERGRNIAALILTVTSAGLVHQKPVLRLMLEILDCRMTYRSRYLANVQPNAVLDLFITDESNPRSIAHQAVSLAEHVDALPDDANNPLRTEEKRYVMAVIHMVRMITADQLADPDTGEIEAILRRIDGKLNGAIGAITLKYLVHSGVARQISGEQHQLR